MHVGHVDVASSIPGLGCGPVWMSVRPAMRSILYGSRSGSITGAAEEHVIAAQDAEDTVSDLHACGSMSGAGSGGAAGMRCVLGLLPGLRRRPDQTAARTGAVVEARRRASR